MSEVKISAEPRSEFGKGAARRIRRAHKVPAVLYGHGEEPRHLSLPGHELMLALKTPNVLLNLELEGGAQLALPKDVQRDPVKGFLEHVDLVAVRRGERVTVDVPVHHVGEVAPGALLNQEHLTVQVSASATAIPTAIEVDIEEKEAGTQIHARDLTLPEGVELVTDGDVLVINITGAPTAEQIDAELAESEAEVGIVHEESTDRPADVEVARDEAAGEE
ncbi:MAG: 50S ribosomal protein L25/general stress protein Ctc [Actinomycetes bacterium]